MRTSGVPRPGSRARAVAAFLTVFLLPTASATKLSEFDDMTVAQREALLNDRANVIYAWLAQNEPETARCLYEATTESESLAPLSPVARSLLELLEAVPRGKRENTILGVVILEWIRHDLCANHEP